MITASTPSRSAVSKASWIWVGEPSVASVFDVQPRWLPASWMILPCSWHCEVPQLMKAIFLPDGIGLPIGVLTVISVGRFAPWARTALASVRAELPLVVLALDPDDVLEPLLSDEEPQPAAMMASDAAMAA